MRKKRELPDVEPVELKPIFGIRPGIVILSSSISAPAEEAGISSLPESMMSDM